MKNIKSFLTISIVISIILILILGNSSTFDISGGLYKGIPFKITEVIIGINIILLIFVCKFHINIISSLNILILWLAFGMLSIFININNFDYSIKQVLYGMLYSFRVLFYIIYIYYAASYLKAQKYHYEKIVDIVISSYVVVALVGFLQLYFFDSAMDFYNVLGKFGVYILNPDPHVGRLISLYLDPNYLSSIIIIGIMLCFARIIEKGLHKSNKYIIFMLVQVIALGLTVSRTGIGALCLAIFVFYILSVQYKNKKIYLLKFKEISVLVILILFTIGAVYVADGSRMLGRLQNMGADPSAQARVESWTKTADVITTTVADKSNTLIGVGYNMIGFVQGTPNEAISFGVDSSLMLIILTTGIIGIVLYLLYVFKTLIDILRIRNEDNFYTANAIVAIFIASLAASFFNNLLFYPLWFFPFLLISNYFIVYYKNDKFIR